MFSFVLNIQITLIVFGNKKCSEDIFKPQNSYDLESLHVSLKRGEGGNTKMPNFAKHLKNLIFSKIVSEIRKQSVDLKTNWTKEFGGLIHGSPFRPPPEGARRTWWPPPRRVYLWPPWDLPKIFLIKVETALQGEYFVWQHGNRKLLQFKEYNWS